MRQHKQLRKIISAAGALGDRKTGMGEARILLGLLNHELNARAVGSALP